MLSFFFFFFGRIYKRNDKRNYKYEIKHPLKRLISLLTKIFFKNDVTTQNASINKKTKCLNLHALTLMCVWSKARYKFSQLKNFSKIILFLHILSFLVREINPPMVFIKIKRPVVSLWIYRSVILHHLTIS